MTFEHEEYAPAGRTIYLSMEDDAVWNDGYALWFDSTAARRKHVRQKGEKDHLLFSLRAGHQTAAKTNVWVCFDLANGHKVSHRYLWIFPTRTAALKHRRQQHAQEGAKLSPPQKWYCKQYAASVSPVIKRSIRR